ncbi:TCR/Tet family MFS transporter [Myroides marinus]|uniref:MFS transporter, DHA1 family, tetracycline resistance protein n=1 Tax=Myroides marinus TaxID=703342 RepID=A0A1H6R9D0_9FLAO|nr:TCR/Tet family MFS transporter [Myroides marinus]KUF45351.1 MFS transporter [Myroides marinus]MDM1345589.1 TCR/Tet family MFS transporter [Myroides marinus]MDM1349178.1 TCR/Tet family MFS transporter [Myroides marinus]MDM1352823.1 TCR/Tet family MFS transporter [Myroides marinus]MDM1356388.1 TCR/Tet family MFS transporter [Myroides marinus]
MTLQKTNNIVIFITITIILDSAGFGIIFPVLPELLEKVLQADLSTAAKYGGLLTLAYAFMQFIFAPILGIISDRYGRRRVLLLSLLGFSIDCFIMAIAHTYWLLFISRLLAGITGATFAVASAAITDITEEGNRTKYFGYLNAAFNIGFIIGPLVGGLLGEYQMTYPFYFASVLGLLNVIYGYFFFPETNHTLSSQRLTLTDFSPLQSLKSIKRFKTVAILLVVFFLLSASSHSMESTWSFYTMLEFNWSKQQVGISLTIIGIIGFLVQAYLLQFLSNKLSDQRLIYIGLLTSLSGLMLLSYCTSTIQLWIGMTLYLLGSIQQTAFQSMLSKSLDQQHQGELQGVLGSLNGVTTIIAPPVFTYGFYLFTQGDNLPYLPGVSFALSAILIIISLYLLIKYKKQ